MDRGASGVMIAPPSGTGRNRSCSITLRTVFDMIGDIPVVLQDFPGSTGVWMSVPAILRLIESFPQIKVVKEEDVRALKKSASSVPGKVVVFRS